MVCLLEECNAVVETMAQRGVETTEGTVKKCWNGIECFLYPSSSCSSAYGFPRAEEIICKIKNEKLCLEEKVHRR